MHTELFGHADRLEWIGEPFDPQEFDCVDTTARLADVKWQGKNKRIGRGWIRTNAGNAGKSGDGVKGGAESGAFLEGFGPDLKTVIAAWEKLSAPARAEIMKIVRGV